MVEPDSYVVEFPVLIPNAVFLNLEFNQNKISVIYVLLIESVDNMWHTFERDEYSTFVFDCNLCPNH